MSGFVNDDHFRKFAHVLERAIQKYGDFTEEEFLEKQKKQVETLISLEEQFKESLFKYDLAEFVYNKFINYICNEKKNILTARPYFRERQEKFTNLISPALKNRGWEDISKFRFNYSFINFCMSYEKCNKYPDLVNLKESIKDLRNELVEMNMPLAISRARIFWSRTPKSQLSYMDLIQISCEGLISAIDKFVPPFTRVFRSVAIGRMVGNFIEEYSRTLIHFYPTDKRKIYKANKVINKYSEGIEPDYEKLAEEINQTSDSDHQTTGDEILQLMSASSNVSMDNSIINEDEDGDHFSRYTFIADDSYRPDCLLEKEDNYTKLKSSFDCLSILEKKMLLLKGIDLEIK